MTCFDLSLAQYMERFTATKKKFAWSVRGLLHLSSVLGFGVERFQLWPHMKMARREWKKKVRTASRRRLRDHRPAAHHRYSTESTCMNHASLFLLQRFYKLKYSADSALWGHLHWRMVSFILERTNATSLLTNIMNIPYPFAMHLLIHLFECLRVWK